MLWECALFLFPIFQYNENAITNWQLMGFDKHWVNQIPLVKDLLLVRRIYKFQGDHQIFLR